jgi:ribosomal protein L11 methyltransferase
MYDLIYVYEFVGDISEKLTALSDGDYIGHWQEGEYSFLFYRCAKKALLESHRLEPRSELTIRHEDWESGVPLSTLSIGSIGIYQPWNKPPTVPAAVAIDPNMVFGSGFHPSTKGCLTLLDRLFKKEKPGRVLDLGTGTGVLSLSCLKLGSTWALGVDSNNLSVTTAARNRKLNNEEERYFIVRGEAADFLHVESELLIANMHFAAVNPLLDRKDFFGRRYWLVSGMIRSEGGKVTQKLSERLDLVDSYSENYWHTYLFEERHP